MFNKFSLEKHLPFKSNYLSIDGLRMHFFDEGKDISSAHPPVILLHGNPTWSFYYRNLIKAFKEKMRVIVPDYIGCGLSDHPVNRHFRAFERVAQLESLLTALRLERFSLVMHDWGGPIGTMLALKHKEKVEKIVYLNTTLSETESLPQFIKLAARPVPGKFLTKHSMQFLKLMTKLGVVKPLSNEIKAGYYFPYRSVAKRTAIWDFVADIPFERSHPTYSYMLEMASQISSLQDKPVLIFWGLKDPCFHKEMLSQVASHFPQARVMEIPDASHLVLEDVPVDASEIIGDFLCSGDSKVEVKKEQVGEGSALYSGFKKFVAKNPQAEAVIEAFSGIEILGMGGVFRYRKSSFGDLYNLVNQYQRGLVSLGLSSGDKVLMLVPPGVEFLALSYAVMGRGAIPVFVDPGIGKEKFIKCIMDTSPQGFIGSPKAELLKFFNKSLFSKLKFHVTASEWWPGGNHLGLLKKFSPTPLPEVEIKDESIVLIAFTSGATGTPKGVLFTHEMLKDQLRIFGQILGLRAGGKNLSLLPIFSLFSLALGECVVFAPLDPSKPLKMDSAKVVKIMSELSVSSSFGSPTLWNKLGEYCVLHGVSLTSLQKVFMAGAPVSKEVLSLVKGVCPKATVSTPYGATEALPVTAVDAKEIEGASIYTAVGGEIGTLVGKVVEGVEMRVVEEINEEEEGEKAGRILKPLHIGEILVRGKNVSPAYLNRPDATKMSKLYESGGGFWHRMGDLGYVDDAGNLYFCGRKAHAMTWKERRYYSIPTERIFNQHKKVRRSALVSLLEGKEVGIVVEPYPEYWPEDEKAREAFRKELRTLAQNDPITFKIDKFFFHNGFPVDARHGAKIFRDKLGEWASSLPKEE